jgi:hypothetical protein
LNASSEGDLSENIAKAPRKTSANSYYTDRGRGNQGILFFEKAA